MDDPERGRGDGHGHAWLPMIVGCLLLLAGIAVLPSLGVSWGAGWILAALVACPLVMFVASRAKRIHR